MFNVYKNKYKFFSISVAIMLIGIIALFVNGMNIDISFKGGAIIKYTYEGKIDTALAEKIASEHIKSSVSVQTTKDLATGQNNLVISFPETKGISADRQLELENALKEAFKDNSLALSRTNIVEPFIGKRFLRNGIISIIIASVLIVIYVGIRFKRISGISAGVMGLVALLHDCLMVFFTFIIFKLPINESFIAVILTIIGYSINDTIVIYDRIRENSSKDPKAEISQLVDKSITQSFTRSLNTSITTVLSIVIMLIFAIAYGIESIIIFALPMAVGMIAGCYSSVFIAGPLWVMWKKHTQAKHAA